MIIETATYYMVAYMSIEKMTLVRLLIVMFPALISFHPKWGIGNAPCLFYNCGWALFRV